MKHLKDNRDLQAINSFVEGYRLLPIMTGNRWNHDDDVRRGAIRRSDRSLALSALFIGRHLKFIEFFLRYNKKRKSASVENVSVPDYTFVNLGCTFYPSSASALSYHSAECRKSAVAFFFSKKKKEYIFSRFLFFVWKLRKKKGPTPKNPTFQEPKFLIQCDNRCNRTKYKAEAKE